MEHYDAKSLSVLSDLSSEEDMARELSAIFERNTLGKLLFDSACKGNIRAMKECIEDKNCTSQLLAHALRKAARNGNIDCVKLLLEQDNVSPDVPDGDFDTALMLACMNQHLDIVKILVAANCNLNRKSIYGKTALHHVAWNGNDRIARVLLEAGINTSILDEERETALTIAARRGNLRVVKRLIYANADVNMENGEHCTALHLAAKWGHLEVIKFLIRWGANIDHQNLWGYTPLMMNVHLLHHNADIVKELCESGANLEIPCLSGRTIAHHSLRQGNLDILRVIWSHGVNLDIHDNELSTVLIESITTNSVEFFKSLIYYGVNINLPARIIVATQHMMVSPVIAAILCGLKRFIKILYLAGAFFSNLDLMTNLSLIEETDENADFSEWFLTVNNVPPTLKRLCRLRLHDIYTSTYKKRDKMLHELLQGILPPQLLRFIAFEDVKDA